MKNLALKGRPVSWERILGAISLIALLTILFWSHNYNDLLVTSRHGINFWNILFDGQIHNFYHLNITDSGHKLYLTTTYECVYNILVYLVFAIWNIPLAILWKVTSIDIMNNVLCLAWMKLLPVTAAMVCAKLVWLILENMGVSKERCHLSVYLMLSSALLLGGVFINSQYDTLGLVFQLLGIRSYLKKDNNGFLFYFGIAICFKLFALLLVIPLLLLREKKISRIIYQIILLMIPTLVTTLPFSILDAIRGISGTESITIRLFSRLFSNAWENSFPYYFIATYGSLMIWCYLHNPQDIGHGDILWVCFCAICSFFIFLNTYPYWIVLMVPYIVFLIALTPNHLMPVMLLLEMIGSCTIVIKMMILFTHTYFGGTLSMMLLPYLFGERNETTNFLLSLLTNNNETLRVIIYGCSALAFIAMAFLSFPRRTKYEKGMLVLDQEIMVVRFLAIAGLTLLPVLSWFL